MPFDVHVSRNFTCKTHIVTASSLRDKANIWRETLIPQFSEVYGKKFLAVVLDLEYLLSMFLN